MKHEVKRLSTGEIPARAATGEFAMIPHRIYDRLGQGSDRRLKAAEKKQARPAKRKRKRDDQKA